MQVLLRFQSLVNEPTHFNHSVYTVCRLRSSREQSFFSLSGKYGRRLNEAYVFSIIYAMRGDERKTLVDQAAAPVGGGL